MSFIFNFIQLRTTWTFRMRQNVYSSLYFRYFFVFFKFFVSFNLIVIFDFKKGRNRPKSGEIRVFGFRPGTKESQIPGPGVGYMPQDIALYNEFSIEETINYFATIFSLSHEVKKSRLQNLLKFLDLPDKNRLVKNLRYF